MLKKHMRKLNINDSMTTDPLTMISEQKRSYQELYTSCAYIEMRFTTLCGGLCQTALWRSSQFFLVQQVEFTGAPRKERVMPGHNTGNLMPYSLRIVCRFFNVPQLIKGCETGPPACSPYPRRLESLTIC